MKNSKVNRMCRKWYEAKTHLKTIVWINLGCLNCICSSLCLYLLSCCNQKWIVVYTKRMWRETIQIKVSSIMCNQLKNGDSVLLGFFFVCLGVLLLKRLLKKKMDLILMKMVLDSKPLGVSIKRIIEKLVKTSPRFNLRWFWELEMVYKRQLSTHQCSDALIVVHGDHQNDIFMNFKRRLVKNPSKSSSTVKMHWIWSTLWSKLAKAHEEIMHQWVGIAFIRIGIRKTRFRLSSRSWFIKRPQS